MVMLWKLLKHKSGDKEIMKFYMCNHKNLRGGGVNLPSDGFTIFLFTKPPINT